MIFARSTTPSAGLSGQAAAFIAVIAFAGAAVAAGAAVEWHSEDLLVLAVLAGFAVFTVRFDVSLFYQSRVSVTVVPILVAATIAGLPGVLVIALTAELAAYLGSGKPLYKSVFNAGALLVSGAAYILVLQTFPFGNDVWPGILYASIAGTLTNFLVNSVLVSLVIALTSEHSVLAVWRKNYSSLPQHYLVLGVLVAAMATSYQSAGLATMAVIFAPVIVIRFGMQLQQAHKELLIAHQEVIGAKKGLELAYDGTVRSLVTALDNRDNETGGHSERVADLSMSIAEELGIESDTPTWDEIRRGALLHDVGKISVPDSVLLKEGSLSDEEWELMRRHPQVGFEIISGVGVLSSVANIVLSHHEKFDGTGYPVGAAGYDIPLGARIFAVADAFDAMMSDRPYRKATTIADAIEEIRRCSGTQFDPQVVDAFLRVRENMSRVGTPQQAGTNHTLRPSQAA
jgi:putative nucleotidyltransferase with HDIG domain